MIRFKTEFFILLFLFIGLTAWADYTMTMEIDTIDTGKTLCPNLKKEVEQNMLWYTCAYSTNRKTATLTICIQDDVKEKDIKDKVKADVKAKITKSELKPTPTMTATVVPVATVNTTKEKKQK